MADKLAVGERANQGTPAHVFAAAAETAPPPNVVQQMFSHAEHQQRLVGALGTQFQQSQDAQVRANQRNT